jgi:hypothetical protein
MQKGKVVSQEVNGPMRDEEIIWDADDDPDGNVQHIAEHDLTVDEVESVLRDPKSKDGISRSSGRPIMYGWTFTQRHIAVIWETVRDDPERITVRTAYEVEPKARRS